jgi:thioredoxin-related protein
MTSMFKPGFALVFGLLITGLLTFNFFNPKKLEPKEKGPIKWMNIEQAEEACRKSPRKIVVDVYTDWCGWCKKMDAEAFSDSALAAYINKKFYAVKLNAEDQNNLIFKEKVYRFNPSYKANDLAVLLLNGQMGYPSFVFLDEKLTPIQSLSGYQKTADFNFVAHYFGEGAYKKKSLEEYKKDFFPER